MNLNNKILNYILILLLALISFGVYINSLHGEFLIDDQAAILNNSQIHNLRDFFSKYFRISPGILWSMIHAINWHISGANTYSYHLFNLLVNSGCVVLIFILCKVLFKHQVLAFLTALIFAVHPIHTEAVSWISGGHYAFSSLFFIAAMIFYVKSYASISNFILALIFLTLCLFSGNSVAALPAMFIVYDLFFRERHLKDKTSAKFRPLILFLIAAISLAFVGIMFISRSQFMHKIFYFRGPSYLIVASKALVYYLKIIYLPLARGLYHPFAYTNTAINKISPAFFLSLGVIFISIFTFFKCLKRHKPVSFGIAWFFIIYLPFSNIIPVCNIVSERYVYLPSLGLIIILAYLFLRVWEIINRDTKYKGFLRISAMLALALFLISYTILTVRRNREYRDIITYWETNINNFPDGYMAYNNLAGTYYVMGEREQALAYCWVTLMINKDQPHVWCNLAKVYREKGDLKMAQYCYEEALRIDKGFLPAQAGLAAIKK